MSTRTGKKRQPSRKELIEFLYKLTVKLERTEYLAAGLMKEMEMDFQTPSQQAIMSELKRMSASA